MPWPFLPPNPDTQPALFDDDVFVFSLRLTGMNPHDEQTDHRFTVDGKDAAVWVPLEISASSYKFAGIGMAPLSSIGSTATYKGTYLPASKTNSHTINVYAAQLTGGVSNVSANLMGSKAIIEASYSVSGGGWFLVAAPFAPAMPKLTTLPTYQALGGQVSVSGSGTAKITVTHSGISTYCVFLARGYPSEYEPGSAGHLVDL